MAVYSIDDFLKSLDIDPAIAALPQQSENLDSTAEISDDGESEQETASVVSLELGDRSLVDTLDLATRTPDYSIDAFLRALMVAKRVEGRRQTMPSSTRFPSSRDTGRVMPDAVTAQDGTDSDVKTNAEFGEKENRAELLAVLCGEVDAVSKTSQPVEPFNETSSTPADNVHHVVVVEASESNTGSNMKTAGAIDGTNVRLPTARIRNRSGRRLWTRVKKAAVQTLRFCFCVCHDRTTTSD